jgi:hypothetical protein
MDCEVKVSLIYECFFIKRPIPVNDLQKIGTDVPKHSSCAILNRYAAKLFLEISWNSIWFNSYFYAEWKIKRNWIEY